MKRTVFAWTLLTLMAVLTACGGKPAATTKTAPKAATKKVIGVSMPEPDNPFYTVIQNWLEKEGTDAGFDLRITNANRDSAKQLADLEQFIAAKVDGIVLSPVDAAAPKPVVEKAIASGIPVVAVGRYVQDADKVLARIINADVEVGRMVGQFIEQQLGEKGGNVALLRGPAAASFATGQAQGVLEALGKNPKIKVVANIPGTDTKAEGVKLMGELLAANKQLDAVYCANDPLALGAVEAAKAANRKVIITGTNGSPAAIESIKAGDLAYSAAKEPGKQGQLAIRALVEHFAGRPVTRDQFTLATGVTKENLEKVDLRYTK